MASLFSKHEALLQEACKALGERSFYTPYPEHHSAWGENGYKEGEKAFTQHLNRPFEDLMASGKGQLTSDEQSPWTLENLGIRYPKVSSDTLLEEAKAASKAWKQAGVEMRTGILIEVLERIKGRFFELAHATMHTSGQSFMMAFQASGPHASDRALEAVAQAFLEQNRYPETVRWEKPMGKFNVALDKTFRPVPKGIGLVIGCSTFPVWNSVPGIFANLAVGNPVIVKPHPGAILPIAMVVAELQKVLQEAGFSGHEVQLAPDNFDAPLTRELAEHPAVKLIDYTGGTSFGKYLESLPNKVLFTEKSGVNPVILDSVDDLKAVLQNLAFAVTLFSGQMCTAPQNFFIPKGGIKEGDQTIPYQEVVEKLRKSIEGLVKHPKLGPGTMAALQSNRTLDRVKESNALGAKVVLEAHAFRHSDYPKARTSSPTLLETQASEVDLFESELFGPIAVVVQTRDTHQSIELASQLAARQGALTCAAYTTDPDIERAIQEAMEEAFVGVSFNLTGYIWVNQAAAFSDFHVSGGNPAGNASFVNADYINRRMVWIGHRRLVS